MFHYELKYTPISTAQDLSISITSTMSNMSDTPPPTPGPSDSSKKNYSSSPQLPTITAEECYANFEKYVRTEKPGLGAFYDVPSLEDAARKARVMVDKLIEMRCGKEVAMQLSLLILYDVALLLGLSPPRSFFLVT